MESELHRTLTAVVTGRFALAEGVVRRRHHVPSSAAFEAFHDPADAMRRYAGDIDTLARHELSYMDSSDEVWGRNKMCSCQAVWPCPEIERLQMVYQLEGIRE